MPDNSANLFFAALTTLARRQFVLLALLFLALVAIVVAAGDLSGPAIAMLAVIGVALCLFSSLIWFWGKIFTGMGRHQR